MDALSLLRDEPNTSAADETPERFAIDLRDASSRRKIAGCSPKNGGYVVGSKRLSVCLRSSRYLGMLARLRKGASYSVTASVVRVRDSRIAALTTSVTSFFESALSCARNW
jgi:hypothetical protein